MIEWLPLAASNAHSPYSIGYDIDILQARTRKACLSAIKSIHCFYFSLNFRICKSRLFRDKYHISGSVCTVKHSMARNFEFRIKFDAKKNISFLNF